MTPPEAFYDFYFLLSRGYPRRRLLDLVVARYQLNPLQRKLLGRCVHDTKTNKEVKKKTLSDCCQGCIAIDAFNQLATIYAALTGHPVYRCSDGLLRDALLGAAKLVINHAGQLSNILAAALSSLSPTKAYIVIDAQPSHSARLAEELRSQLTHYDVEADVILDKNADKRLISFRQRCVVASSDIVIVKSVARVYDLAGYVAALSGAERAIINITRFLRHQHQSWCTAAGP